MFSAEDYEPFVRMCTAHAHGEHLPRGISTYTRYFLVDSAGTVYAQGDVRHRPTKELTLYSGYLGYGVLPSWRENGFGTLMCGLLIRRARVFYPNGIIITCKTENVPSSKIIEHNGGRLLDIRYWGKQNAFMKRYEVRP